MPSTIKSNKKRFKNLEAFTLIELVLYIALAGLLAGILGSVFYAFIESATLARREAELSAQGDQIVRIIDTELRNAQNINSPSEGSSAVTLQYIDFEGVSQTINLDNLVSSSSKFISATGVEFTNRSATSGGRLSDKSGNGNGFSCPGPNCPNYGVAGQIGEGAEFTGNGASVEDIDADLYVNGLSEFTLSIWVNSDTTGIDTGFVFGDDPNSSDNTIGIRYDAGGFLGTCTSCIKAGVSIDDGSIIDEYQIESSSNTQTTIWQHLVVTWSSGGQLQLYIDGSLDTPSAVSPAVSGTVADVQKLVIGKGTKDSANSGWDGLLDEFKFYDQELTAAQVSDLYNNGSVAGGPTPVTEIDFDEGENRTSIEYEFSLEYEDRIRDFNSIVTLR
ncbi:MAG: LamG-like jellyroll fold domain-containing protein [Candidatus Dojkabacteria bacterium]